MSKLLTDTTNESRLSYEYSWAQEITSSRTNESYIKQNLLVITVSKDISIIDDDRRDEKSDRRMGEG